MHDGIREADVQTNANGVIANVRLVFGPHHFVELHRREDGGIDFVMGLLTTAFSPTRPSSAASSSGSSTRCARRTPT